jgi:hypothetical protein
MKNCPIMSTSRKIKSRMSKYDNLSSYDKNETLGQGQQKGHVASEATRFWVRRTKGTCLFYSYNKYVKIVNVIIWIKSLTK